VYFFFLDASGLGKRYAPEVGTPLMNHLFAMVSPDRFLVFDMGMGEVLSLLVRKRNSGRLPAATFAQALADFQAEIIRSTRVRILSSDTTIVLASLPFILTHSINSTDAVVLRLALELAIELRPRGDDLVLVASDQRLLRAAQTEGLFPFNPETQSQADLDALIGP
jgi:predicted nucleic acid-binding protein